VLAQDDFGFDIERCIRGYRITRGPMFGFRLWRFLFEVLRSATDKRQAHVHTVGRFSYATIRAPSAILGELSETKVPGEPFTIAVEGNWRPYLPLPDDFVSILNLSWLFPRTVRFYTCQGVTEVQGPRGLLRRLKTGYRLTKDFAAYARLRNWDEKAASTPDAYIEAMQKLGFEITFRDHGAAQGQEAVTDLSVLRFFPCLLAMAIVDPSVYKTFAQLLQDYSNYFGSAFENSLMHLLIFVTTLMFLFCARHFYANWTLRVARLRIALCIGGWGTRGKSGTERLKAAFLARLGYSMVSKSTGCEAMFLHNHNYGELLEIPFFRPYEKATIWEQRDIVRIAAGLNASVFLWECMGLTPSYVNILQRQWMNDDLSTITNTYPDHEDLQGPAGYDVAQTIAEFVPVKGHVFTTEQQMRPILADKCRVARTSMCGIGWLESGLITDDIMDRFPYKEHPDNIALVLAISDELNCERDFALKAMADDMVPDLGVLKTYPLAHVRTRKLEFTNGMSANERFGCLGNWSRLSFDQLDVNSDTWVSTVVNNRADRVARSRVFASILVNDISADRHFIIGSNLKGLQGQPFEGVFRGTIIGV
jgi:poly-gamma-glutamate synthase PgsB/CapB